jgi:hypothetical protein
VSNCKSGANAQLRCWPRVRAGRLNCPLAQARFFQRHRSWSAQGTVRSASLTRQRDWTGPICLTRAPPPSLLEKERAARHPHSSTRLGCTNLPDKRQPLAWEGGARPSKRPLVNGIGLDHARTEPNAQPGRAVSVEAAKVSIVATECTPARVPARFAPLRAMQRRRDRNYNRPKIDARRRVRLPTSPLERQAPTRARRATTACAVVIKY